jgi:energy-coupling factor transport system substrate-specific component
MTFGFLMDLQMWPWLLGTDTSLSFNAGDSIQSNLERFIAFHFLTAMAWDIPRSFLTAILIGITGAPILNALRRTERRAFFVDVSERATVRKAL